ncbi:MAG: hypothetical protein MJA84_11940, partial [Firmicutes bacterium]|nr:hypothetical protein [Bacillota bacterium]
MHMVRHIISIICVLFLLHACMNPFDDGSSGADGSAPEEGPPVDGAPEPSAPGELDGIESGGEYYSGVAIVWTEDESRAYPESSFNAQNSRVKDV